MSSREELTALLARLEAATGPDRELDADIMLGLGLLTRENRMAQWPDLNPIWQYTDEARNLMGEDTTMVRRLTGSIDAALGLLAKVLSGWDWAITNEPSAWLTAPGNRDLLASTQGKGATPQHAILAALLKALLAPIPSDTGETP